MNVQRRSLPVAVFVIALAATVMALGLRIRTLEARNRGLMRRFTEPHPGMLVPAFTTTSVSGDSILVGTPAGDLRQVVFFFTTTCGYCGASLEQLRRLDAELTSATGRSGALLLIGLDSAELVRRYADSLSLDVPVLTMPSLRLALLYRVRAVPQLMVIDSSGRAVFTRAGALVTRSSVDSVMRAALGGPQSISSARGRAPN